MKLLNQKIDDDMIYLYEKDDEYCQDGYLMIDFKNNTFETRRVSDNVDFVVCYYTSGEVTISGKKMVFNETLSWDDVCGALGSETSKKSKVSNTYEVTFKIRTNTNGFIIYFSKPINGVGRYYYTNNDSSSSGDELSPTSDNDNESSSASDDDYSSSSSFSLYIY
jgi:hypothetical protein